MTTRVFSLRFSLAYGLLMLGTGVQLPFLPLWLSAKGIEIGGIALIVAAMMAVRVCGAPLFAWAADHSGDRRKVTRFCSFAAFVAFAALPFMEGFWPIAITAMFASFLFAPVFPLVEGFGVDASAKLGIDYGRLRLWASLSFLTGSLVSGALLTHLDPLAAAWIMAGAQGFAVISTLLLPGEPKSRDAVALPTSSLSATRFLFASGFTALALVAGLGQASHGMLNGFSSLHWTALGYQPFAIAMFWSVAVVAEVILFAFSNAIVGRFGPGTLLIAGLAGGLVRWTAMAQAEAIGAILILQTLHALSFGMTHLGTMHIIRQIVPDTVRNRAQGFFSALSGGVLISGSIWLSGPIYAAFGGLAYLFMAGMSAAALAGALLLLRSSPRVRLAAAA